MEKEVLLKEYEIISSEKSDTIIIKVCDENRERNLCLKGSKEILFALCMELIHVELPVVLLPKLVQDILSELGARLKKIVIYDIIEEIGRAHV